MNRNYLRSIMLRYGRLCARDFGGRVSFRILLPRSFNGPLGPSKSRSEWNLDKGENYESGQISAFDLVLE